MRANFIIASVFAITLIGAISAPSASAARGVFLDERPEIVVQQVDDNDDTRVEVQLVVAGIVAAFVVGVGSGAYLLRKRLGRVAPPPDQSAGGHH